MTGRRPPTPYEHFTRNDGADREWTIRAACRGHDEPDLWYIERRVDGRVLGEGELRRREARAKAFCHTCPVITECRDHGRQLSLGFGIWGGLNPQELQGMTA